MGSLPTKESGFTLVEMLVALFAFAILSAASTAVLTSAFRAKRGIDTSIASVEDLAVLDTLLRQDFDNLSLRPTRDAFGAREPISLQLYAPDNALIRFTRTGRANPEGLAPRGDLMRVSYHLEDGQLIRRSPALPTPSTDTPVTERIMLSGIRNLELTAFSGTQEVLQVSVPAGSDPDLAEAPDRLRFRFELESGGTLTQLVRLKL